MNFQQLEYIVALEEERHFARAAERCHVTQPTLSMMVQKLEEELGLVLFDRKSNPLAITAAGEEVLRRSKEILLQTGMLKQWAKDHSTAMVGKVRLGCIPTIAPYLLPTLLTQATEKFPFLQWEVQEIQTARMEELIREGQLDIGILALPSGSTGLKEYSLFYEEFYVYHHETLFAHKKEIEKKDLDGKTIWLMEEGHCFRNQVYSYCSKIFSLKSEAALNYQAGSIETLKRMVDRVGGITFLPAMAIHSADKKKIKPLVNPKPGRTIGLVTRDDYPRAKIISEITALLGDKH